MGGLAGTEGLAVSTAGPTVVGDRDFDTATCRVVEPAVGSPQFGTFQVIKKLASLLRSLLESAASARFLLTELVMPQVDLDSDVFEYLQSEAQPLVDTPSTVLRRLLKLNGTSNGAGPEAPMTAKPPRTVPAKRAKRQGPTRTRAAAGTILPEERYELPLLRALVAAGGRAPYREIVGAVGVELKDDLMPADLEALNSGTIRWQSRLQFVRLRLIERGLLDKDTPRGVWGITDAGRAAAEDGAGR